VNPPDRLRPLSYWLATTPTDGGRQKLGHLSFDESQAIRQTYLGFHQSLVPSLDATFDVCIWFTSGPFTWHCI